MEPQNNTIDGNIPQTYSAKHLGSTALTLIIGVTLGVASSSYLPPSFGNYKKGYSAGFNAARTLVENSSLGNFFRTTADVRTLSGTVTAVNGNRITFHLSSINPFEDQSLNDRTAMITASTTMLSVSQKDSKAFQAEMEAFKKALESAPKIVTSTTKAVLAPTPSITTDISAEDVKVGETIEIITTDNVKNLKEFPARYLRVVKKVTFF